MSHPFQQISSLFPLWGSGSSQEMPLHRNAGLEIVYISRGGLRWRIEDRIYNPGPGSIFYTFPWELHGSMDEFEPGHQWEFVVLTIIGDRPSRSPTLPSPFGMSPKESRQLLTRLMRSPNRSLPAGELLGWLLPALRKELTLPGGSNVAMSTTLAKAILLELDRIVASSISVRSSPSSGAADGCDRLLRRIQVEHSEAWNLQSMSKVAGLGRTLLARMVKERTGDSPLVHLNRLRIAKARELLKNSGQSVTEIAFICGFQSSQYFAHKFKQFTGHTPGSYRTTHMLRQQN